MNGPRRISQAELHAYVDGELAADERAEVEALLATAPADLELARELRELNEALKHRYARRLEEKVPPQLQKTLARFANRRRLGLLLPVGRWAATAVLLIAAGTAGYLVRSMQTESRGPE